MNLAQIKNVFSGIHLLLRLNAQAVNFAIFLLNLENQLLIQNRFSIDKWSCISFCPSLDYLLEHNSTYARYLCYLTWPILRTYLTYSNSCKSLILQFVSK